MPRNTPKRVAQRFLRKAITEVVTPEVSADVAPVPANRFVDLAVLVLAYQAHQAYLVGASKDHSPNSARGMVMIKRYSGEIVSGMTQIFTPLAERNDSGSIRAVIRRALQMTSPTPQAVERWALAIKAVMPWLKVRSTLFNSLFTGRSTRAAREVAIIAEEESPASALNKLAGIAPVSGLMVTRKWIEVLAAEAGAPLSPTESVLADAQVAKTLGEDLTHLDASLAAAQPNTPVAAELQGKRVDLISQIDQVATTSNNPAVVLAVAAQAKPSDSHATEIGKRVGHTPDQEDAMMVRGRAVIAAGAGSGKTRVLASKVAYHINELGVPASAILATSFTRKASAELIDRCGKYGATIQRSDDGFGTTHSIAGRAILDKLAPGYKRANYIAANEGWKQTTLFRLAMEQVKMGPLGIEPPEPKGLWDGLGKPSNSGIAPAPVTPQDQGNTPAGSYSEDPAAIAEFVGVLRNVLGYLRWAANTWGGGRGMDARKWLEFMQDIYDFGVNPSKMTPDQRAKFNEIVSKLMAKGQPVTTYRVAARGGYREPGLSTSPEGPNEIMTPGFNLFESDDPPEGGKPEPATPMPRGKTHKMEERVYFKNPARQWFNLGLTLMREDSKGNKTPIPMGEFRQVVSILKGKGVSASEAWTNGVKGYLEPEEDSVAVYGAYEWLKGSTGEPEFQNTGDMDDLLIDAVAALRGSSTVRQQIQSRFKVLLVDEAQDLNRTQHLMFGLMAGYLDPATMKPWPDGHMTADTFALIGDDKQCVEINTLISLPNGQTKRAGDMCAGDSVLSWRNGAIATQTVRHAVPSAWDWGYAVTLESGKTITMSPNHKLWATEPQTGEHQVAVYLMFRSDMGYRVGITNKGKVGSEDSYLNSYVGRCFMEKAERLWILDVCESRDEALTKEARYSLRYGIPTAVFCGENRGLNQDRIDTLFKEFGQNGADLLQSRFLSPHYPHWMSQSFTKHGRERHTVQLIAHTGSATQVAMEWTGDKFDDILEGEGVRVAPDNRRRLRRWFTNYRNALAFAEKIERVTGANLSQRLAIPGETPLRKITASGLHVGMSVPVEDDDTITLERIVNIDKAPGQFIDLDVDDASNFFGNGILTSNSIYEFRGADPEEFISKSNMVENGGDFQTKLLDMNFRSGEAIVQAANNLIAKNKRQVPMICKANAEKNGQGRIASRRFNLVQDAAAFVAEEIQGLVDSSAAGVTAYKNFGLALRSNAEAYMYGVEMLKKGIPFKSNARFFNDPNTKALIGWLSIADKGLNGPPDAIEEAIRDCTKAPFSLLGAAFFTRLEERAVGSWAQWLVTDENWRRIYASGGKAARYYDALEHFVANLEAVSKMTGTPSEVIVQILELRGADGVTTKQAMINNILEDDEVMAELAASSEGGSVTEEQISEQALAPIEPLLSLVKGRDDIGPAMVYIQKLKNVNAKVTSADTDKEIDRDAVTIGTMHSWKGLEVPTMYIPMIGGKFPRTGKGDNGTAPETPALASERRLAYVAITRAEQRAIILDIHGESGSSQFLAEACILPERSQNEATAAPKMASKWDGERIASMG